MTLTSTCQQFVPSMLSWPPSCPALEEGVDVIPTCKMYNRFKSILFIYNTEVVCQRKYTFIIFLISDGWSDKQPV
jgi:hypothetical protein